MPKQKPADFIKYKFRSLKTYTSTEWLAESKKKYRQVFDRNEVKYIYAEFSFYNKLFDEEDWEAEIILRAFRMEAAENTSDDKPPKKDKKEQVSEDLVVHKFISKDQNEVYIREGWGNEKQGKAWPPGDYYWEAYVDGTKIATHYFYVYEVGLVQPTENPYFSIQSVRLYEGPNQDVSGGNRNYVIEFDGKNTRFVWVEFEGKNKIKHPWVAELIFNFYNDARQLKGQTIELTRISESHTGIHVTSGWGSDHRGTWFEDNYTVEIVFMDTLVGVIPFKVGNRFLEGEQAILLPDESGKVIGMGVPGDLDEMSLDEVLVDMDALIGLNTIKSRIREYAQYLNFLKLRQEKGFEDEQGINLHAVFTGNPGTGKTTVARMLGRIYRKLGLLSKGHVHEVDRSDIIGEYIGQTAPKVKEAITKAQGGILFIDEAYSLARSQEDKKDYGREVIELLVKEMSGKRSDFAIVVAGYPKEMTAFLDSNPGLKSRFTMTFEFPDYIPEELHEIAIAGAENRFVHFAPEASGYLSQQLVEAYRNRDRSFGNARFALSLVDEAKMNLGLRVMRLENAAELTKEELSTITLEDVQQIFEPHAARKASIPIDEGLLQEALQELNGLVGLERVKSEVNEMVKLVRFYKEIGKDVLHSFSLHSVFTGNPGTGKTTIARILGKIYKALGILERGHMVECDRQALVAGFVGGTAIKTAEIIERARGGVLFLDEAYTLSKEGANDFGREAIETLLKRMEDLRGEIIVIAAGYPENMTQFLEANPGLKSRFDRKFEFADYKPAELMSIAEAMLTSEGIAIRTAAHKQLLSYFTYLYQYKNKFFGNARAVRKVVEKAIKNQHLRLASLSPEDRKPNMLKSLVLPDVQEFDAGNDSLLEGGKQGRVGF